MILYRGWSIEFSSGVPTGMRYSASKDGQTLFASNRVDIERLVDKYMERMTHDSNSN